MGATERRKWFGLLFRAGVDSLVWQRRQGGGSMEPLVTLFLIRKKREIHAGAHLPVSCSLWILSETSVHGTGPPVFRVGLPSSVILLGTTLTDVPGSMSPR